MLVFVVVFGIWSPFEEQEIETRCEVCLDKDSESNVHVEPDSAPLASVYFSGVPWPSWRRVPKTLERDFLMEQIEIARIFKVKLAIFLSLFLGVVGWAHFSPLIKISKSRMF
jgi:hypothetical protein